ncbi:hypothetical protein ANOM_001056 [Aspergillus nomiae NRRL 13137]|uniref:Bactericidal permeability-increasing protein n=1 Tax=Aspergillus nomiae NRRL (strain ATCC 15546 / NRRL 13137 / CBS 260.88 / M93) TaxID=1509407 RepID=A0A0L1JFE1_ASPN3|nr:uncharacterized protein ANOM_001056 [Aspergillus nomiae NRRL 13137]KNG90436.1 hypothetical protein ANOM_001056 [Aspergillus nomiae NRRL 13137]
MSSRLVNRPIDTKQRDKDINQKLQLYGIYQAFKNGKLPSNKQCDVALNSALKSKALSSPSKELSEEGQALLEDVRDVIEQAKRLILSKNDGQLIQEFIWEAQSLTGEHVGEKPDVPWSRESAQQHGREALEGLKTLGNLLITNGEFRKLLNDAWILVRDIAGDASQKAANQVRPSEEQLAQVDQPAEDNTWHEKPDYAKHKEQFTSRFRKNRANAEQQANEVADTAVQAATSDQRQDSAVEVDGRTGAAVAAEKTREKLSENIPEEQKSRARDLAGKTKNYLSRKMPKERREQAIWRLKKMIIEIQGRADYQRAIETLLSLAEKYGSTTRDVTQQGAGTVRGTRGTDKISKMEKSLRVLIERFANSTSLDDLFDSLENIYRDADRDPELKGWFKNMDTFIRKSLQEQGYIMQEDWDRHYDQLSDHGRYLLRERYRDHTDRILDEVKFIGEQFAHDPQNKAFGEAVERLFTDLGRDSSGNVSFKPHLLTDLRDVILPGIFENVRYVPIPRIEVSDPMADVVVENLVVESDNLMPNVVEFGSDNYLRWGRKKISSKRDNKIMISVSGIQADLRDVSYYINKKQGFPAITDEGVMDIFLGGDGFGFKITASNAHKEDRQNFVKLDKVSVKIDSFDIKLKKSRHKALFTIFKPLLFRTVRPVLQKVLEQQVRDAFSRGDAFAYEIHSEVKRAKEAAIEDPANAPSIYSRYLDAMRAKMEENKQKAQAIAQRASHTQVQTATTLHDSLFPEIQLPGGISSKATEYKELAERGERWESPIFTIGDAPESTNIPAPADITRKPHTTSQGRIADDNVTSGSATATGAHTSNGSTTVGATNGSAAVKGTHGVTNGATNGVHKANGYGARGFSDQVDKAFTSNGGYKATQDGVPATIPGAEHAFNPQTA